MAGTTSAGRSGSSSRLPVAPAHTYKGDDVARPCNDGDWGDVSAKAGRDAVRTALDAGIDFLDTADVYGDGFSERRIAEGLNERDEAVTVATKVGRRLDPHTADGYDYEHLSRFVDRSRKNLGVDSLDLVQLHCPPTATYYRPETFEALDRLRADGRVDHYGVSVEKVEQALKAVEYPGSRRSR